MKSWLNDHPDDARALSQYGSSLLQLKQLDDAEKALRKSLSIDPTHVHTQTDLVVVLYAKGNKTEAEKIVADAARAGKLNGNSYASIGYTTTWNRSKDQGEILVWEDLIRICFSCFRFHLRQYDHGWIDTFLHIGFLAARWFSYVTDPEDYAG